jgi:hypothetical protein
MFISAESCALAENPAGLNGFDDGEEAKPVINRVGNPTVSPGNVASALMFGP